jgi:hypothetical protein
MHRLLFTVAILLAGCTACSAQISTMGTTSMGLASTPGAIVTSPLNGPSPFSATTQPGTPDTTLAPVPPASDPTTPGTVVTCSTPTGQIAPGTPPVPVASMSVMVGTTGTMPSVSAAPTISAPSPSSSSPTTGSAVAPLTFSQQPETSFASVFPDSTIPAPQPPAVPPLPLPSISVPSVPTSSTRQSTASTSTPGTATTMTSSTATTRPTAMMPAMPLGTIPTTLVGSTTGTISPVSPLGSSSTIVCSSTPGGPPTNGAALPLYTPEIPSSPPPGTIQPVVTQLGGTSIDPTMAVMPTPNTSACAESMTMNVATPGTLAPANASGAAATPGVSPAGC